MSYGLNARQMHTTNPICVREFDSSHHLTHLHHILVILLIRLLPQVLGWFPSGILLFLIVIFITFTLILLLPHALRRIYSTLPILLSADAHAARRILGVCPSAHAQRHPSTSVQRLGLHPHRRPSDTPQSQGYYLDMAQLIPRGVLRADVMYRLAQAPIQSATCPDSAR
ncbi:hypothetical protein B0H13DRAFT_2366854 [Mycena leptocephala]|nr:hypothetical protein B0H13DRAFT_2366854 [Mycena leptocephala]